MGWLGLPDVFLRASRKSMTTRSSLERTCAPFALGRSLEVPCSDRARIWTERLTWCFVGLGLVVRLVRFGVCYPLWPDEAYVAVNFLSRDYAGLLKPLEYGQVSPPVFLWIELLAVRMLGFSEWALRFWPILCGLSSVVVFRFLAGRFLARVPLLVSVALFATAASPIRHSAEVKPYASDLLAALVLLFLAVEWWRCPRQSRWWWILALSAPFWLGLSNPALFVAAGLSLAMGPAVLRSKNRPVMLAFFVYNLVLAATFVGLYAGITSAQSGAVRSAYRWGYWRAAFPPLDQPWRLPLWFVAVHTGNMLAYPIGGHYGLSTATFCAFIAGSVAFWRQGRRTMLMLLLAPFAMGMAAAMLGAYPYGQAPRVTQYQAPSICILSGLGISALLLRLSPVVRQRRALVLTLAALFLLGAYSAGCDIVYPYRVREDDVTRRFARWFWTEYSREADLVCAKLDLGLRFQPKKWKTGASAVYLCHHRMYARSRSAGLKQGKLHTLPGTPAPDRPVRLVFLDDAPQDDPLYAEWLARISAHYQVKARTSFVVQPGTPAIERERYVVLELVPKEPRALAAQWPESRPLLR